MADPLAVGIDATGLTWFSPVVKISALFGLFSTMLVQLLGQTRIFFSMSRDGLLPDLFGRGAPALPDAVAQHDAHRRRRGAWPPGLLPLSVLSQLVSIGSLLAFVLVCIGVLILRRTAPDVARPFRVPGVPWVPVARRPGLHRADGEPSLGDLGAAHHLDGDRVSRSIFSTAGSGPRVRRLERAALVETAAPIGG